MHYIKYVEIEKNGAIISKNKYSTQPAGSIFTYTYNIPAEKGDVFEVKATCNLWGHKTSTLVVAAAPVAETSAAPKEAVVAPAPVAETPAAPKEAVVAPAPVAETPAAPKEAVVAPAPIAETPAAPKEAVVAPAPVAETPMLEKTTIALNVKFDTAKAVVKKKYHNEIKKVADFMKAYPETKAIIEGYTDNVDKFNNPENNIKLSSRADSAARPVYAN